MTTPLFSIVEWEQNQEQPHVTVNTAIRILEIMSQLVIADFVTEPPTGAVDGDAYYVDGAGAGAWAGQENVLALLIGSAWHYVTPRTGFVAWSLIDGYMVRYDDSSPSRWVTYP